MILSTMNDLPGYEVTEVLGEVFGITVRSRNVGSQLGVGFKSLVGGELKGMTKTLSETRLHAQDRLIEAAQAKGADAVLAMRFDASEFQAGQEICAYGTAVKIRPVEQLPLTAAVAGPPPVGPDAYAAMKHEAAQRRRRSAGQDDGLAYTEAMNDLVMVLLGQAERWAAADGWRVPPARAGERR